jgi:hypothetical protein
VVLLLAAAGVVQLLWRDRRSLAAVFALAGPYVAFHLLFQDTSFIRYALPLVPVVAFLAVRGVSLVSLKAVPAAAALLSIACAAIASPVLVAYRAEPSPAVRAVHAMQIEGTSGRPWRAGHAPDVCPAARSGGGRPDAATAVAAASRVARAREVLEVGRNRFGLVPGRSDAQRSRPD